MSNLLERRKYHYRNLMSDPHLEYPRLMLMTITHHPEHYISKNNLPFPSLDSRGRSLKSKLTIIEEQLDS